MAKKKIAKENCSAKLGQYGGQAVIEGVMMMGKTHIATAIRKLDGEIIIDKKEHQRITSKYKWLNIPILRGCISFFESMIIGMKSLMFSAEQFDIEDEENTNDTKKSDNNEDNGDVGADSISAHQADVEDGAQQESPLCKGRGTIEDGGEIVKPDDNQIPEWMLILTMIVSLAISIGLFIVLPSFIANLIKNFAGNYIKHDVVFSIIESLTRLLIFFLYLVLVSFQEDVSRVFKYHGAEHKTINCYEAGEELTVKNAMKQSRFNPRCGTSFLFIVMIISIIIYSIPVFKIRNNIFETIGIRVILLPLIAGISYEMIKLLGTSKTKLSKILSAPGMWFQSFTTKEPDEKQIEVAIAALKATMEDE